MKQITLKEFTELAKSDEAMLMKMVETSKKIGGGRILKG